MELAQLKVTSPFGDLYLVASAQGLRGIYFKRQKVKMQIMLTKELLETLLENIFKNSEYSSLHFHLKQLTQKIFS